MNGDLRCFGSTGVRAISSQFSGTQTTPTDVLPHLNVKSIEVSTGGSACLIDSDDKLHCLGTGTLNYEINRQWTKILPAKTFKKVALSGQYGSAGYACAQDFTDKLWCWNYEENSSGRIKEPVEVTGITVKDFAVAGDSVCIIDTADKIFCKGGNQSGVLGNGTSGLGTENYTFTEILGNRTYKKISGAIYQVCAIDSLDKIYCWGTIGWLGNGTSTGSATPTAVNDVTSYSSISNRGVQCGITTAGILKCWGQNSNGEVGNSRPSGGAQVLSPSAVTSADTFLSVSTAHYETACAINSASKLFCWGDNGADDRLGTGSTANYLTVPTAVDASTDYQSVSAGSEPNQNCAVTTSSKLKCWGSLSSGLYYESKPNAFGFDHAIPYTVPGVTGN